MSIFNHNTQIVNIATLHTDVEISSSFHSFLPIKTPISQHPINTVQCQFHNSHSSVLLDHNTHITALGSKIQFNHHDQLLDAQLQSVSVTRPAGHCHSMPPHQMTHCIYQSVNTICPSTQTIDVYSGKEFHCSGQVKGMTL